MATSTQLTICIFVCVLPLQISCSLSIPKVLLPLLPNKHGNSANNWPSCLANSTTSTRMPSCSLPSDDLPTGRFAAGSQARNDGLYPKWINLTLAKQGQQVYENNKVNIAYTHVYGLISLLAIPDVVDVLTFTQKSDTVDRAAMRYTATMAQVLVWYKNAIQEGAEDDVVLISLANVRKRHITAAQNAAAELAANGTLINPALFQNVTVNDAMWTAFENDLLASNISQQSRTWPPSYKNGQGAPIPLSQFALAMTQFAFIGFPVLFPERVYIDATDEELFAFNHLWAVLGYALGIQDDYNIALQPDLGHVKDYYQHIFDDYYMPALFSVNSNLYSKILIESTGGAFQEILPILTTSTLLQRLLRDILKIGVPNMSAYLPVEDKVIGTTFDTQYLPLLQSRLSMTVLNEAVDNYLVGNGIRYFGANYTSEKSKAENVYYA